MGVQNLWVLLAPVGRQIEIESLAGKVLAVDASIWLTQFVKAMRDDEGKMIKNAHLIGTFHRVAKLLFYGIKPVFVFDGDTPEIKKRTTARRRRRQEHQAANLKQTAQRILINQLKLQREELKRNGGKPTPAVAPNFVLPGDDTAAVASVITNSSNTDDVTAITDTPAATAADPTPLEPPITAATAIATIATAASDDDNSDSDNLTIDDIVLDTSRLDAIDLHAVFALPAHLQKDMLNRILSDRRQEVRNQFIPLAGQPEAYSHTQLAAFLGTTKLHQRIEAAKIQHKEQVEAEASANATVTDTNDQTSVDAQTTAAARLGPAQRIASRSDRFFVYKQTDDEHKSADSDADSVVDDVERSSNDAERALPLHTTTAKRLRESDASESSSAMYDEAIGKQALSDLSVGSIKDFAMAAQRQQTRRWAVEQATAAWMTKHATLAKTEPTLAIESARRKRLKRDDDDALTAKEQPNASSDHAAGTKQSLSITFKVDDVASDDVALFPASLFEAPAEDEEKVTTATNAATTIDADGGDGEDDDDVDWEEVPSAPASSTNKIVATADATSFDGSSSVVANANSAVDDDDDENDDDSVEWEDVRSSEQQQAPIALAAAASSVTTAQLAPTPTNNAATIANTDDNNILSDNDNDDASDDNDDLFLSLKDELEDAKAQGDLANLRGEALKSALATASNLTQWAAGAVRRAIAAHSLQHKQFVEHEQEQARVAGGFASPLRRASSATSSPLLERRNSGNGSNSSTPLRGRRPLPRAVASLTDTIEIIDEDERVADSAKRVVELEEEHGTTLTVDDTAAVAAEADEAVENDEQLQQAIAASIAADAADAATRGSRYLEYAAPSSPHLQANDVVDVAAIESEQRDLKRQRQRQLRDVDGFNDDMVDDVMALLRLFGVPFLVCPMEAEAQCVALEQLGLVDGIITDDSDVFPFGGKHVYKNIFHHHKFVEAFYGADIERELGFAQDELIALALLLGSDYTDGVRGIGIVNATEIVSAYPGGCDGLREFKRWVHAFDVAEEATRVNNTKRKQQLLKEDEDGEAAETKAQAVRKQFEATHASARRKWELGDEFPNARVVQAYTRPHVDRSDARFSWAVPDLAALRTYTAETFGWDQAKADGVLLPLVQRATATAAGAARGTQTRIDQFFRTYDDEVRYATIQSKRLRSAVATRAKKKPSGGNKTTKDKEVGSAVPTKSPAKAKAKTKTPATTPKKSIAKKKTTLAALGFGQ